MNRLFRRLTIAAVATLALLVPASLAWACVAVVSLTTTSSSVQPGGTLTVVGREFAQGVPVQIHLDSLSGPLLTTAPGPSSTMNSKFTVTVAVPSDISSGQHLLIATQNHHDMNSGNTARSAFYVGAAAPPAAPSTPARPLALVSSSGRSGITLVLIALGVAVAALAVVGVWSLLGGRGNPRSGAKVAPSS